MADETALRRGRPRWRPRASHALPARAPQFDADARTIDADAWWVIPAPVIVDARRGIIIIVNASRGLIPTLAPTLPPVVADIPADAGDALRGIDLRGRTPDARWFSEGDGPGRCYPGQQSQRRSRNEQEAATSFGNGPTSSAVGVLSWRSFKRRTIASASEAAARSRLAQTV